ncbi:response regulator [Paenibacillus sp. N3/727]|uniref:response regulator transcription factor n=1 Tax=Paenibacillus sp. N3/727 TaxID=2925845 RepID=UPI001F52C0C8|nr:helix-turn-helix domain-containing protein [Paenibacillus sp. N3/727]UNK18870.1 response regulator [Paenibacillus sp. N3/727]
MKVLIVDDEVIIRTGLSTVINWEGSGFSVLEPAASAEEALQRIPCEQPDIIFTDIRMTGMSGIELAREVMNERPDTEMIIISGFDEFIYAQQAMREGVSEYLLKTSRPDEIIQAAIRAKARIEQRRQEDELGRTQERAVNRSFLRRLLASATLPDEKTVTEMWNRYPDLRITQGKHHLQVWIITFRHNDTAEEEGRAPEVLYHALGERLTELLPNGCEWLQWDDSILLLIRTELEREGISKLEYMIRKAGEELNSDIFAACGQPVGDVRQLRRALDTAVEAASYEWLLCHKGYVHYEDISERKGVRVFCTMEEEKELAAWLRAEDPGVLKSGITELLARLRCDHQATPSSVRGYLQTLIVAGHRWLERTALSIGRSYEPPNGDKLDMTELAQRPEKVLMHHFETLIKQHAELVSGINPVQRAVAYIHEHLGQGLSLQQVAKHVHMNSNYFSELFKRETGQNYIEFVTQAKMQKAMALLRETPAKISEVANEVGYEDMKYFNRLFKKFTGMTPSEYRANAEIYPSID